MQPGRVSIYSAYKLRATGIAGRNQGQFNGMADEAAMTGAKRCRNLSFATVKRRAARRRRNRVPVRSYAPDIFGIAPVCFPIVPKQAG